MDQEQVDKFLALFSLDELTVDDEIDTVEIFRDGKIIKKPVVVEKTLRVRWRGHDITLRHVLPKPQ